jgi:hypothetical protein
MYVTGHMQPGEAKVVVTAVVVAHARAHAHSGIDKKVGQVRSDQGHKRRVLWNGGRNDQESVVVACT